MNIIYGEYEEAKAYKKAMSFLKENKEVMALFAISDMMSIGVAKYYEPTITTIEQPKDEMSKMSVYLLFDLLDGETQHKHILLDVELVKF